VPVVASRRGGIIELVREGETGFLVDAADAEGAAECLARLALDPRLRNQMSRNARASVDGRFDERFMAARIAAVYRAALADARGRSGALCWASRLRPAVAPAPGDSK
jgi:glycosyltransferase involved in cell wall biosynthesis